MSAHFTCLTMTFTADQYIGSIMTIDDDGRCPNVFECSEDHEATFLIGGEQCTRRCDFCTYAPVHATTRSNAG